MRTESTYIASPSRGLEYLNEWIEHTFNPWFAELLTIIPPANSLEELLASPYRSQVNKVIITLNVAAQYSCHRKSQPYDFNLTPQEFEDMQNGAIKLLHDSAKKVEQDYFNRTQKLGYNDTLVPFTVNTANYGGINHDLYNWNGKNYDVSMMIFPK